MSVEEAQVEVSTVITTEMIEDRPEVASAEEEEEEASTEESTMLTMAWGDNVKLKTLVASRVLSAEEVQWMNATTACLEDKCKMAIVDEQ